MAKAAGVARFVFSSSCSLYGAQGDGMLDETAAFNPVTPYGAVEGAGRARHRAASPTTTSAPTYLRNGTAYGVSPRHCAATW